MRTRRTGPHSRRRAGRHLQRRRRSFGRTRGRVALLLDFCGTACLDESEAMISTAGELNQPVATSRRLILWLVLLAQFVVVLDGTIVAVALPAIESNLHFANQLALQWVINACAFPLR